ncbi:MAG: rod shape-determining protein MreD [Pseudomonadota bacterium]|nr:rod shape-determining protein MreD [Pseudomonadota bacterium]
MSDRAFTADRLLIAVPGLLAVLLVMLGVVPLGVPFVGPMLPDFALIAVYVFAVQRPDLMPHWLAFLVGLLQDLLSGGPLGFGALICLGVQGLCSAQRRFLVGRPFAIGWIAFALVALAAGVVGWLLACVYYFTLVAPAPALLQFAITVALFPLVAAPLLTVCHRLAQVGNP